MVKPVDVVVERSELGEVEVEGKVAIKFSISDVRVARVSHGFIVATGVNIIARFLKSPERIIGVCGPGVQYRATSFVAKRIATAVVKTDGDGGIETYIYRACGGGSRRRFHHAVVGAVRLSSDGDCVENSDCDINITRHAVMDMNPTCPNIWEPPLRN